MVPPRVEAMTLPTRLTVAPSTATPFNVTNSLFPRSTCLPVREKTWASNVICPVSTPCAPEARVMSPWTVPGPVLTAIGKVPSTQ
jgi:hypothetical protein